MTFDDHRQKTGCRIHLLNVTTYRWNRPITFSEDPQSKTVENFGNWNQVGGVKCGPQAPDHMRNVTSSSHVELHKGLGHFAKEFIGFVAREN